MMVDQLKEAYEQMLSQPTASGSQGMSDESGTDNDSKVIGGRSMQSMFRGQLFLCVCRDIFGNNGGWYLV